MGTLLNYFYTVHYTQKRARTHIHLLKTVVLLSLSQLKHTHVHFFKAAPVRWQFMSLFRLVHHTKPSKLSRYISVKSYYLKSISGCKFHIKSPWRRRRRRKSRNQLVQNICWYNRELMLFFARISFYHIHLLQTAIQHTALPFSKQVLLFYKQALRRSWCITKGH